MNLNKTKEMYDRAWKEETNGRKKCRHNNLKNQKIRKPFVYKKVFS